MLLLDEPLGSLDRPLRERLLADLEALFDRLGLTVLHVTHDVGEAFALGDRVAVMRSGRIVQVAAPDELWARPADAWVARFLGLANVRERTDGHVVIRPEAVLVRPGEGATVVAAERRGPMVRLRVRRDDGEELEAVTTELDHPRAGDRVSVEIDPAGVFELPARTPSNTVCEADCAREQAPRCRPRARAGRLLPGDGAPARAGRRGHGLGRATAPTARWRQCSRASGKRSSGSSTSAARDRAARAWTGWTSPAEDPEGLGDFDVT